MSTWTPKQLNEGARGTLVQSGTRSMMAVSTDSRSELKDRIFFALKGDNFDAHDYVGTAVQKGAAAVVVCKKIPPLPNDVTVIEVEDTLVALQNFANWHRHQWKGKLIGLTGSNGKTTTKEFAKTILSQKFETLATEGNLNNHIGVPLTLLELRENHKFGIIEMGMNHAGEITQLAKIANPDIVIVTNVGRAHIGNFGTIEGIAKAKEELYEAARPDAVRIYNLDNQFTGLMRARAPGGCEVLTFSSYDREGAVSLKEKVATLEYLEVQGHIKNEPGVARINAFGRQNISNAMAASCIALACRVEPPLIWQGLKKCKSIWGRGQMVDLDCGAKVLFDGYNANPDSCAMAMENFAKIATRGKKYLVVGDMLELGESAANQHYELGVQVAQIKPDGVYFIGQFAKEMSGGLRSLFDCKNVLISETYQEKLASEFGAMLVTGDIVLVKGSRGMKLERVVQGWHPINFEQKH